MADFKIFVEGVADKKFLQDLVFHLYKIKFEDIESLGGKDTFRKTIPRFKENSGEGKRNILIFDSNGDKNKREKDIKEAAEKYDIQIDELFLIPNNSDPGNLETILLQLVNPKYNSFFECFESYLICLKADKRFTIPDQKVKVYAYNYSLLHPKDIKMASETKRDYLSNDHWNLDHECLKPLKKFLSNFFNS